MRKSSQASWQGHSRLSRAASIAMVEPGNVPLSRLRGRVGEGLLQRVCAVELPLPDPPSQSVLDVSGPNIPQAGRGSNARTPFRRPALPVYLPRRPAEALRV